MDPRQFLGLGSLAIKRSLFLTGQVGAIAGQGPGYHRETIAVPKWASFMYAWCAPGGSGGGGGFSGAAGTNRGGGGGGACVHTAAGVIPTRLLPSHVDVIVGYGGIGGTSGVAPMAGSASGIYHPTWHINTPTALAYIRSGSAVAPSNASATAGGGSGLANAGVLNYLVAGATGSDTVNGGSGGAHTGAAGNNSGNTSAIIAGGGGGGGIGTANTPFGGGVFQLSLGTYAGGSGDGGNGVGGVLMDPRSTNELFFRSGGSGGASGTTQGGRGGNGGWGCGGGGGGAGVTGGQGGSGGPGFVWIIFF